MTVLITHYQHTSGCILDSSRPSNYPELLRTGMGEEWTEIGEHPKDEPCPICKFMKFVEEHYEEKK